MRAVAKEDLCLGPADVVEGPPLQRKTARRVTSLRRRVLCTMIAVATILLGPSMVVRAEASDPQAARVQELAEEAYIYGLPIVMNYAVMHAFAVDQGSSQFKAPFNRLHHEARVFTPKDTAIVTPNSDTPYSISWLDLRAEPFVVSVPAVDKQRYYSVMLCDGNTFNFGIFGSQTTGKEAGDYLVVGPEWRGQTPPGIRQVYRSTTQFSMVLFRTQLFGPADLPKVREIQAGYKIQPLSSYLGTTPPPAPAAIAFPKIDKDLAKVNFFAYLDFALQFAPPGPEESVIRMKLASLGLGVGNFAAFTELAAKYRRELGLGMKAGEEKIARAAGGGANPNGWIFTGAAGGDRAYFAGDWLRRAVLAKLGIYALNASEAVYPLTRSLPNGEPLDGGKHRYSLTFAAGQLPPARAFWSLTMYHGASQLLVDNAIDRYLINSPMLPDLKRNADGSLTIYIQNVPTEADVQANWLPAPDGPIFLVLRLYDPQESILKGTWQIPPVVIADQSTTRSTRSE